MAIANTTIQVRKSGTTGAKPTSLANGELAINFADDKLYYVNKLGNISYFYGANNGPSFSTANANNTLLLATNPNDTLSIVPGNNITITACTTTKTITVNSVLEPAFAQANAAFNKANTSVQLTAANQTVTGNVNIVGNLSVSGNVSLSGNVTQITGNTGQFFGYSGNGFNALYAGIPTGYLIEPQTVFQISSNFDGYAGLNMQNINSGANSSSDFFVTADNGTVNDGFLDLGLASSTYNYPGYTLIKPNDGYLIVAGNTTTGGGNAIISTGSTNDIIFALNGTNTGNEVARFKYNVGLVLTQYPITFADNTKQNTAAAPFVYSNSSYVAANSAGVFANSAFIQANNISSYANAQITIIQGVDATQNTNIASAQSFANGAFVTANNAASFANGAFTQANTTVGVDATQNTNIALAQSFANSAFIQANNISSYANAQIIISQGVNTTQNTNIASAQSFANAAFVTANSAASFANGAFTQANTTVGVDATQNTNIASAQSFANGAFTQANAAFTAATTAATANTLVSSAASGTAFEYLVGTAGYLGAPTISVSNQLGYYSGNGTLYIGSTDASVNTSSGALQVTGGAVVGGNLRANAVFTNNLYYANGTPYVTGGGGSSAVLGNDTFTGNGANVSFTLSTTPYNLNSTLVNINGAVQQKSQYSITNNILTFTAAPASGDIIEVMEFGTANGVFLSSNSTAYVTSGSFNISNTTVSTSNTTGALVVLGGIGTSGNIYSSGIVTSNVFTLGYSSETTGTFTTASTTQVAIDTWSTSTYRTVKYLVQLTSGTSYHAIELMVVQNGTTPYMSQYNEVTTGSILGTFDASISAGVLSLLLTATNAITTVKFNKQSIIV